MLIEPPNRGSLSIDKKGVNPRTVKEGISTDERPLAAVALSIASGHGFQRSSVTRLVLLLADGGRKRRRLWPANRVLLALGLWP